MKQPDCVNYSTPAEIRYRDKRSQLFETRGWATLGNPTTSRTLKAPARMALATQTGYPTFAPPLFDLARRSQCPANTFGCPESLGEAFRDICCATGQTCALDDNHQPACCPQGAVCTGTAPSNPQQTAAPSYVSNSYFSFPYAPTTFTDQRACSSAAAACSKEYDACVTKLQDGSAYGVTIVVPQGGGKTVDGAGKNIGAQATSICSSLSSEACPNLSPTTCASYGGSSGTPSTSPVPAIAIALLIAASVLLMA